MSKTIYQDQISGPGLLVVNEKLNVHEEVKSGFLVLNVKM